MKKFKVDLHLHTIGSYDAVITFEDLKKAYDNGKFDVVAITDHGTIAAAVEFSQKGVFPVVIGEEIETKDGDLIGLFLKKEIAEQQSIEETISQIKSQEGLVYIPHPFDTLKFGLRKNAILPILPNIDLFETHNFCYGASIFHHKQDKVAQFAAKHNLVTAASSDAHVPAEIGKAYLEFEQPDASFLQSAQAFLQACGAAKPKMQNNASCKFVFNRITNAAYVYKFLRNARRHSLSRSLRF